MSNTNVDLTYNANWQKVEVGILIIELTEAEAIVLSDFLYKNTNEEKILSVESKAQRQALWNLECLLEKNLPPKIDVLKAGKEVFEENIS